MLLAEDLRKSVLQFALQGKITQQLATDSSVDLLIESIKQEKEELVIRKNARRDAGFPKITDDEIEFEIPANWRWIRLSEIGVYKKGPFGSALTKSIFVPKSENSVKVYEQKNAIQKDANLGEYYITRQYYEDKMKGFTVESGDVIVSCAGTIGETYVMPDDIELGIINQALMRMNIVPSINLNYFLLYFDHILKKNAKKQSNGSAIKNIPPFEIFKSMLLPLPPVEEQQRIVERISIIMKEIDEYEELEEQANYIHTSFPYSMERAVLQYAMQGKIVKQEESDTNVELLIDSSQKTKEELIRQKVVKKEKVMGKITEEDIPYEVPSSWRWVRFHQICNLISGCDLTPDKYNNKRQGVPYLTGASNIDEENKIIINRWVEEPRSIALKGDLLLTCKGTVGKTAFLEEEQVHIARQIMAIRTYSDVNLEYIHMCIKNYVSLLRHKAKSMIPGIDRSTVLNLLIPLPPLEEQKRIVERLEQILPLIDDLKL